MAIRIPDSICNTEAWESLFPILGGTPKSGSAYPQLQGPHQSVGIRIPNTMCYTEAWDPQLEGHTKAWESPSPTPYSVPPS